MKRRPALAGSLVVAVGLAVTFVVQSIAATAPTHPAPSTEPTKGPRA